MRSQMLTLMLLLVLAASAANAQDYAFKVLVNKGQNQIRTGDKWIAMKAGSTLKSLDELKVGENAYVGLIHATGRPLELRLPGNYKVSDLSAKMGEKTSVLNKYTDFILTNTNNKRTNLTATGAVHRGPNNIKVYLPAPEHAYVYSDSITIQWSDEKTKGPYVVVFTNFFSDELARIPSDKNFIDVNLNDERFKGEDDIQVQVFAENDDKASDTYILRKLSQANRERVQELQADFRKELDGESALNTLLQASFYEQNKLYIDAATAFLKASLLAPDVASFKEEHEDFLKRNGLKD